MGTATTASTSHATTSIRIEREKLDALKAIAARNRRSVSQELRWLIDQHVDATTSEKAA